MVVHGSTLIQAHSTCVRACVHNFSSPITCVETGECALSSGTTGASTADNQLFVTTSMCIHVYVLEL